MFFDIYALSNGTKSLTIDTAEKIANCLNLKGSQLLQVDYIIPGTIRKAPQVKNFYDTYKDNPEYFKETKSFRKTSAFIEEKIVPTGLFKKRVYVWEIKEACVKQGQYFTSKQVAQAVDYMAVIKKLNKETALLKKKNGEYGVREVQVYFIKI